MVVWKKLLKRYKIDKVTLNLEIIMVILVLRFEILF